MTEERETGSQSAAQEDFVEQATTSQPGQMREMIAFVWQEKKWFLTPLLVLLFVAGLFVVLSGTQVAPFIYALF